MFRPDIPFSRDDANRFLPWMIALMCAITALMLCVGITLGSWVSSQQGTYSGSFTVQIPSHENKDTHAQAVEKILDTLENTPGVSSVEVLGEDALLKLVEPWLGNTPMIRHLPYPTVIDVKVDETNETHSAIDFTALQQQLSAIAPDAFIDTQEIWVEKFSRFSHLIQTLLYSLAAFILAGLTAMMIFAARATMKLHSATVHLLHTIGADDRYIAKQFQQNALALSLRGAVPGTLAAAMVYTFISYYADSDNNPLISGIGLTGSHIAMLLILPLAAALISLFAVRYSTLSQLKLLP